ncbi:MAG: TetR/AcrR family transcriptional regulator [Bacteroidia bacterium]|nr:TetR/AcrR family transcriptional regulator [Bacteroidia bacterium]
MRENREMPWIVEGYRMMAFEGVRGLNIQAIAKNIGKNKSSFYHHFGDLEGFYPWLFKYHIIQFTEMAELGASCSNMNPELLDLMVERKLDIFFHRQLRLERHIPEFKECYEKAFAIFEDVLIEKGIESLNMHNHRGIAKAFLSLVVDNFLLRITDTNYKLSWMQSYLFELQQLTSAMIQDTGRKK